MAWLSGWNKRQKLTLTGGTSGAQVNYQLKLTVTWDSDMQSDFDDLRFTKVDGTTLIDAWLETHTASTSATVWVEFPTTPANTVTEDYYMYYGNSGAASAWNGSATFLFYDDTEARTNGDLLTAHSWTQDAGSAGKYSNARAKYGSIAVELSGTGSRYHQTPNIALPYIFEYWTYSTTPDATTRVDSWAWVDDFLTGAILDGYSSNKWQLYNGAYQTSTKTVTVGWHHVKLIVFSDGSGDVYVDDDLLSVSFPSACISAGEVGVRNYDSGDGFFDNLLKRKYAASPATYVFGSEENVPVTGGMWYYKLIQRRNR